MNITKMISQYNWSNGNDIQYITLHDTGNDKDSAWGNANYFNGGDRQASAHYFVDENSIYQVVEEYNASWHCGDGRGQYGITNHNSIGIEMCNSGGYIAESTINNTLELVRDLMARYNIDIDHVVRHYDASHKTCPNNMSANNWAKWYEFKSKLSNSSSPNNTIQPTTNQMPTKPMYIVTNYLPVAYQGYDGIDVDNIIHTYFNGIKCYIRSNQKGTWIETEYVKDMSLLNITVNALNNIGLFYSVNE